MPTHRLADADLDASPAGRSDASSAPFSVLAALTASIPTEPSAGKLRVEVRPELASPVPARQCGAPDPASGPMGSAYIFNMNTIQAYKIFASGISSLDLIIPAAGS